MDARSRWYPAVDPNAPVACDVFLSADPVQDQRLVVLRQRRCAPPQHVSGETGLVLRFRAVPWELAVAFVEHERLCCPFLTFELEERSNDELQLRVWGRPGTLEFIRGDLATP